MRVIETRRWRKLRGFAITSHAVGHVALRLVINHPKRKREPDWQPLLLIAPLDYGTCFFTGLAECGKQFSHQGSRCSSFRDGFLHRQMLSFYDEIATIGCLWIHKEGLVGSYVYGKPKHQCTCITSERVLPSSRLLCLGFGLEHLDEFLVVVVEVSL